MKGVRSQPFFYLNTWTIFKGSFFLKLVLRLGVLKVSYILSITSLCFVKNNNGLVFLVINYSKLAQQTTLCHYSMCATS